MTMQQALCDEVLAKPLLFVYREELFQMASNRNKNSVYDQKVMNLKEHFLEYPRWISIETMVKCNAKCSFCPYPISPRKGEMIEDELFYKIIDELSVIPTDHPCHLVLARINEPLLDKRLQVFSAYARKKLPGATMGFWSNGTTLTKDARGWIGEYDNATLHISLNSVDEKEHSEMMGIGLAKVLRNLDAVHKMKDAGTFLPGVSLHAPFQSEQVKDEITSSCKDRFPLFNLGFTPFFSWEGDEKSGSAERQATGILDDEGLNAAARPCGQWFDLHVLANGYVTKCCIDQTGFSEDAYDTRQHNVMDIFQRAGSLRENLPARGGVSGCETCTHLS